MGLQVNRAQIREFLIAAECDGSYFSAEPVLINPQKAFNSIP
jgi:hypothetical protein